MENILAKAEKLKRHTLEKQNIERQMERLTQRHRRQGG